MWKIIIIAVVAFALLAGACYRLIKRRAAAYVVHEVLHMSDFARLMEKHKEKLLPESTISAFRMSGKNIPAELKRKMTNPSNTLVLVVHASTEGKILRVLDVLECVTLGSEIETLFTVNNNCVVVVKS